MFSYINTYYQLTDDGILLAEEVHEIQIHITLELPSLGHSDFTAHASICLLSSFFPHNLQEIDRWFPGNCEIAAS